MAALVLDKRQVALVWTIFFLRILRQHPGLVPLPTSWWSPPDRVTESGSNQINRYHPNEDSHRRWLRLRNKWDLNTKTGSCRWTRRWHPEPEPRLDRIPVDGKRLHSESFWWSRLEPQNENENETHWFWDTDRTWNLGYKPRTVRTISLILLFLTKDKCFYSVNAFTTLPFISLPTCE